MTEFRLFYWENIENYGHLGGSSLSIFSIQSFLAIQDTVSFSA